MEGHHRTPGDVNTQSVSHAVLSYLLFMELSPSALLATDCYVASELCYLLIVITAAILSNETGCAGYVTSMNANKAACLLV
jgi:hypothetical protein